MGDYFNAEHTRIVSELQQEIQGLREMVAEACAGRDQWRDTHLKLDLAVKTLERLNGDYSLWKKPTGYGGQDQYAGMPAGHRIIDEALAKIKVIK